MGHMQGPTDPNHGRGSYFGIGLVKLNTAEAVGLVLDCWNGSVVAELQLHIKIKMFASSLLLRVLVQFLVYSTTISPRPSPVAF